MFPRHATDIISLFFGIIFTGLTVVWLLVINDIIDDQRAWIGGPITLVAAGAVGLVAALQPRNRSVQTSYPGPPSEDTEDPR
jgi:hypothetical protein